MSKLWIVHRNPSVRAALARATGLASAEIAAGAPTLADFAAADTPAAILLALAQEGDLESALGFAEATRARAVGTRWIVLCAVAAARETRRVFGAFDTAILALPPDRTALRAELAAAFARPRTLPRNAALRGSRAAERFETWLGGAQIPGLARALDPAFRALPLLVRGHFGSGRSVLVQHAELSRGGSGRLLRLDAGREELIEILGARLAVRDLSGENAVQTIWLDGLDRSSAAAQRALADWIAHELAPVPLAAGSDAAPLRWLATAGPADLEDRLEPALARAFVPLVLELPPLAREGDEIPRIAERVARLWAQTTGGPPRVFGESALAALAAEPWWGERAELVAVLRATLAEVAAPRIEATDLRFPDARAEAGAGSTPSAGREPSADALRPLPIDPAADPNPAWRRLARSLAHEIRNPLVSIRTFTELLPDHHADETFRIRFKELVGRDVAHIQDVVARLAKAAERERLESLPVDVSALIERLLTARRERIAGRRLLVLSELEHDLPLALADADALETALAGLVDRALDSLPDRGDLFITTHRIPRAGDGRPRLRVLLRHHNPLASGLSGELDPVNHILEYVLAETIVAALGGRLTIDPTLGPETLIVIDLPTPP